MTTKRRLLGAVLAGAMCLPSLACIGSTGGDIVRFRVLASGPPDATSDIPQTLTFTNGRGWRITLTRARLHIGGVYLNRSVPVSGGQERECFLPGLYVAQELRGVDVNALSAVLQPFPDLATGTQDLALAGEVWLTGGRVDALEDHTSIAEVAGTAKRGAETLRFEGTITIGRNRTAGATDPARPGAKPLCAERIVTPIPIEITPRSGGRLVVRVDPRAWFGNVELGELEPVSPGSDLRRFRDDNDDQPSFNLYAGVRAATGVYTFEWLE